jgi:hypothetical protein
MKTISYALSLTLVLLAGCSLTQKQKTFPLPAGSVTIENNLIFCNGKPFAELKYFEVFDDKDTPHPFTEKTRGRGLVIYYYHNDKEVWIHPEERLSIKQDGTEYTKIDDMKRVRGEFLQERKLIRDGKLKSSQHKWAHIYIGGSPWRKEDAIRSVFYGVKISDDGKYVFYKTQGMFFDSSNKYLVEYGETK